MNGPPKKYNKYPPSYSNDVTPNNYGPAKKLPFAPNKLNVNSSANLMVNCVFAVANYWSKEKLR